MDEQVKKKTFTDFTFSFWLARFMARVLITYHEDERFRETLEDAIKNDLKNGSGSDMFTFIALSPLADKYTEFAFEKEKGVD